MSTETQPFAITLNVGSSLKNETGSWRTERPIYVDLLPPCNKACPAGENIQQWLYLAEDGNYEAAWRQIMVDNPMPATMGRVCYHPCQVACNRGQVDEAVMKDAVVVPIAAPKAILYHSARVQNFVPFALSVQGDWTNLWLNQ